MRTVSPSACTWLGNWGRAVWMRFCTKTVAAFRSVPTPKVIVSVMWPSPVDEALM